MTAALFECSFFSFIKRYFVNKLNRIRDQIVNSITSKQMDVILELVLNALNIFFILVPGQRKSIKTFRGKIAFKSEDGGMHATAFFKRVGFFRRPGLKVLDKAAEDADVTLSFKNGSAMAGFLLSGNPDIIAGILDNKLSFTGNVNYLYRFVYLVRHIPVSLGIQLV